MKTYWNKTKKEKRLSKSENLRFRQWLCESFSRCQICGVNPPQDAHHLSYGSYGADKDDRTQIAVCRVSQLLPQTQKKKVKNDMSI